MTERRAADGISEGVQIRAPAKVNLILRVLDRRPDGYHNLWSLMHTVAVEDRLRLRVLPDSKAIQLTSDDPSLPTDARNLIVRAASRVMDRAGLTRGLAIDVAKRIPMGAGLGGGSSDAAATVVGLNHLLGLGWSRGDMVQLGAPLGSDVPFFFFAPSGIVRGRGEEVTAIRVTGQRWAVLIRPGFAVETKWAYARLSSMRKNVRPLSAALNEISAKRTVSWEDVIPLVENDFEDALATSHGVFREIKQALITHGAQAALLSGSGSTVVGLFRSEADAIRARELVGTAQGYWARVAPTGSSSLACSESS